MGIGDFYGDPSAAIIDWHEKWCITVGCGLVLYWLREPFPDYQYNTKTPQWSELHRDPPDVWWIETVYQVADDVVRFVVDPSRDNAGLYELRVDDLSVVKLLTR